MDIEAAVAVAPGEDFVLQTISLDAPRDDEVLVKIVAVGVCHTDLVFRDQQTGLRLPAVFGHEGTGIVEAVGAEVTKVAVGDRVVMTFRSCGDCRRCSDGQPAYCAHWPAMNVSGRRLDGSTPLRTGDTEISGSFFGQSSFASHALAYERNLVKVAADAPLATYAPLGCGVQTGAGSVLRSLDCARGSSLAIIGAGTVGLSALLAGLVRGCAPIIVIDPLQKRRDLALELGAHHAIDPAACDVVERIRSIVAAGIDHCIDTSGSAPALQAALDYLAPRGMLGLVGIPVDATAVLTVPIAQAMAFGFGIRGIIEGDSDPDTFIPELIALHEAGRFPFDRLIASYAFADINRAIRDQAEGRVVKVVLTMPE